MYDQKNIHIEEIAQPRTRLPSINIFSHYSPTRRLMATMVYSDLGSDAALHLIDVDTLEDQTHPLPKGANYGFRTLSLFKDEGGREKFCFASSADGALYSFDLETESFERLALLVEGGTFFTGTYPSSSGAIYAGNYPDGALFQYNPKKRNVRRFDTLPKGDLGLYCTGFIDLPDGRMLILTTGGNPGICVFEPDSGNVEIVYRGNPANETRGFFNGHLDQERVLAHYHDRVRIFNWRDLRFEDDLIPTFHEPFGLLTKVNGDYYFGCIRSGAMLRSRGGTISQVKDDFPNMNIVANFHHLGVDDFACVGDNGLSMRFNLKTGQLQSRQIDNESSRGMGLQFLRHVPGEDIVVGAHFINSQMFKIDLNAKTCDSSLSKATRNPGQINCGATVNDKFYIGSYVKAVISEYDWRRPFDPGKNPRKIADIGNGQNRPIDMASDGKRLFIATGAGYGALGGAITILDPASGDMDVHRNFVPEQNPTCMFLTPDQRHLVGGTTTFGDCGTAKGEATEAVLFLWDIAKGETTATWVPWSQTSLRIIDMSPNGLCLGTKNLPGAVGEEYFLWNPLTNHQSIKPWPLPGVFIGGVFMSEKNFHGATEHGLFNLNVETNEHDMLTQTTKQTGSYCTKCFERLNDNEFLFDLEGVKVMKARISNSRQ